MKNTILIFGASGSGTSTLGRYLGEQYGWTFLDADDYFWMPTDPRFTVKRDAFERVRLLEHDIAASENTVLSGSLTDWGNALIPAITLAVRLITDTEERLKRIRRREYERFGSRILPGGDMYAQHQAFLEWAAAYDDGDISVRSRASHDAWQKRLSCRLLILSGGEAVEDNAKRILTVLQHEQHKTGTQAEEG